MVSDSVANFALRGASDAELSTALARCQQDFFWWNGQAVTIARFPMDARAAGIDRVFAQRNLEYLSFAESTGILISGPSMQRLPNSEYARLMVPQQLEGIEHSARIAAIVMLHSACERYYWRLVRLALIPQRAKAVQRVADRKIKVQELVTSDCEALIDSQLERWWAALERESLLDKWDALISLMGSPDGLRDGTWHFDRDMLVEFDSTRHECVHHAGSMLRAYDFDTFAGQVLRSQFVWSVALAKALNVKIPAEIAFGIQK